MNAAALTAFFNVVKKRLQEELESGTHQPHVAAATVLVISTIEDAAEVSAAAILPQERGPTTDKSPDQKPDGQKTPNGDGTSLPD